jgi:nicotinamide mononucleotide transporter
MSFTEFADAFLKQLAAIDALQWAVLVLGVSEVLLARANNIWLYPTGIAATTLAIIGLFRASLFAECLLHLYYIVMSVYGWWYWSRTRTKNSPPVTFTSPKEWWITAGIVFLGWGALYIILISFTTSDVPAWDAWVSSTAWAGMWLLAKRKVENWLLLNLSNAFAIPLLFIKDLPLFGVLTVILFLVACKGYFDWRKKARRDTFIPTV